jgi:hypothetical protein
LSSILKALKKVEKEGPQQDDLQSPARKVDTREVIQKRVKGTLLLNRLFLILCVAVVLGLGGWVFRTTNPFSTKGPSPQAGVAGGEKKALKVASLPGKAETERTPAPAEEKKPEPKEYPAPPGEEAQRAESASEKAPVPAAPEKPGVPVAKSRRPETVEPRVTREPPEASRFKLEAIVWSSNPESRFAVINGRIVRAGGAVEAVDVREIGRDFVALRSGGQDWKLRFTVE